MDNIVVPIYDFYRGTTRHNKSKILKKTQWLSVEEIKKIQLKNVKALIKHAYDSVPHYHELFKKVNLYPSDIKKVEDLLQLPVLTKSEIQKNKGNLLSKTFPKKKLIPYDSGGTSQPIKFFITDEQKK